MRAMPSNHAWNLDKNEHAHALEARVRTLECRIKQLGEGLAIALAAVPAYIVYDVGHRRLGLPDWPTTAAAVAVWGTVAGLIWKNFFD